MIECPGNPFDTFEPNGCHRQPRRRPERTPPAPSCPLGWGLHPEPVRHPMPGLDLLAGPQVLRAAA